MKKLLCMVDLDVINRISNFRHRNSHVFLFSSVYQFLSYKFLPMGPASQVYPF